jgi:hypothetical protein
MGAPLPWYLILLGALLWIGAALAWFGRRR